MPSLLLRATRSSTIDSVFAMRRGHNDLWDLRIWLEVEVSRCLARGVNRDGEREGTQEALAVHRDRDAVAERISLDEVAREQIANIVLDNIDFAHPFIVAPTNGSLAGR